MANIGGTVLKVIPASFLVFAMMSATVWATDLSKYRNFQLGTDLPTIARQMGVSPVQAKAIHRRPALIQELEWRPQSLGSASRTESAQDVVFRFYEGELFRIAINYDRYETEGLTADDFIEAISVTYGIAEKPVALANAGQAGYGDREEIVARWQDSQFCFDLIRSSYGPGFRLIGILKRLEAPAQAAILEAARLDDKEAPQREADRMARQDLTERANLEKARLLNKPRFRP